MLPVLNILILLAELWILSAGALLLHRWNSRIGLAPLFFFLGGVTAAMQFQSLGTFQIQAGRLSQSPGQGSFIILPVLLLGLLLIYVVNGTTQARFALLGMILVSLAAAFLRAIPMVHLELPGIHIQAQSTSGNSPQIILASVLTLIADLVIMILIYQFVSNRLGHYPSRLAAALALIAAVWCDAVIFPGLANLGIQAWVTRLPIHLIGKTVAVLAIQPLLLPYLRFVAPTLPDSDAANPRPGFDLFTTTLKLEARARYQYNLLKTLSQINELVARSDEPRLLLQQACELLASSLNINLVWAGQRGDSHNDVHISAYSGKQAAFLREISPGGETLATPGPYNTVLQSGKAHIMQDITKASDFSAWREAAQANGFRANASFPMRHAENTLGVLNFCANQPKAFENNQMTDLLQELADDLGYALANLEARRQQSLLHQAEHNQRQLAEALAQATIALTSSLNLDQVLDQILEQVIRVVPCRSVNIMLVEGDQARVVRYLDRKAPEGTTSSRINTRLPLTIATLSKMRETRAPILVSNTHAEPSWIVLPETAWILSYSGAPLLAGGQIIGFLSMNSDQEGFFNEGTLQRLQAFAATASIAIQNARNYQDLQSYSVDLEGRVQQRTAELSSAKNRIEAILASVPDAVYVLDQNNHLLEANQAGENLLMLSNQEKLDLFDSDFLALLRWGEAPDENAILEVDGRAYQALASSLPLPGKTSGLVIVFRDVTRFRELDQLKSQFVSDVSHELRTPLTNLTIYLDLLSEILESGKGTKYLATLQRETERLTHLIEDLLTISRLEDGRLEINNQPMDTNQLVENLANDRAAMANRLKLNLHFSTSSPLPLARADPRLLTQVLSNLLTNAMNYTPPNGSIHIYSDLQFSGDVPWVTISVADTGVGILAKEADHIFDRFYRGAASQQAGAPGTGLGLSISKEIIERLGGYITVQSEPGKGSTFTVWLQAISV